MDISTYILIQLLINIPKFHQKVLLLIRPYKNNKKFWRSSGGRVLEKSEEKRRSIVRYVRYMRNYGIISSLKSNMAGRELIYFYKFSIFILMFLLLI